MIHIYWGLGKGKTSALNGSAIRALGSGNYNPVVARFLKGKTTSEDSQLEKLGIKVVKKQTNENFVAFMKSDEEKEMAKKEAQATIDELLELSNNMLILDEFIDLAANNVNFFTEDELISIINKLSKNNNEVLISGHTELPKLFEIADLITFFKPTKHYFEKGQGAREGIEY